MSYKETFYTSTAKGTAIIIRINVNYKYLRNFTM